MKLGTTKKPPVCTRGFKLFTEIFKSAKVNKINLVLVRGDGLANDALATRLPRPAQVGAGAGEPEGECGGPQESCRGRGPVEIVY